MKQGQTLADKAYQRIKHMFVADQLVGGQKLQYQDLARRLDMSQTPVIQALNRLELEGLVRSEANKGFFVAELGVEEAGELYDMRGLLEVYLIVAAAARIKGDARALMQIKNLQAKHQAARGAVYRRERLMADAAFHLGLAALAGNKTALAILRRVFDSLFLKCQTASLTPERLTTAEAEHQTLVDALAEGDGEQAAEIMARHIAWGREHILEAVKRQWRANHSL